MEGSVPEFVKINSPKENNVFSPATIGAVASFNSFSTLHWQLWGFWQTLNSILVDWGLWKIFCPVGSGFFPFSKSFGSNVGQGFS